MGECLSTPEERQAKQQSAAIDRELRAVLKEYENTIKILVLGAMESGKSTVVKQMKIIYGGGYSQHDLDKFTPVIYLNLVCSMRVIVINMKKLGIPFSSPINRNRAQVIHPYNDWNMLPPEITKAIRSLWCDEGVRECFSRSCEYDLNDSASYYLENMERILESGYTPNEQDILCSRVQTTGMVETSFKINKQTYRVIDVGGARSERRKWIQCFNDVRAVLFVCALSGYDRTLFEDGKTNRLEESLNLFQAICNNKFFTKTCMILFLNKVDQFREKILHSDRQLRLFFPEYTGNRSEDI